MFVRTINNPALALAIAAVVVAVLPAAANESSFDCCVCVNSVVFYTSHPLSILLVLMDKTDHHNNILMD
jgi:hypothetical protein